VDFEKRISGASYEELAAAGGGIRSSVDTVRRATRPALTEMVRDALARMLDHGTTTVEAKSGYGLRADAELKSLQAISDAAAGFAGTVVPTLLGAHVVPDEFAGRADDYEEVVCQEMIPEAAKRKLVRYVDVFLERGAFRLEEARRIFATAQRFQLGVRAHVCQLTASEIAPILAFEPASLDHLDHISDSDIRRLSQCNTIATLLPGASYFLGLTGYAPARRLIDGGAAVALATDYNPGSSPTLSMPMVLSLACTHMKMTPAETIAAGTFNGAHSLGLAERKGSIEPGKDADLACFHVKDYREIPYWFGENRCRFTVANGFHTASGDSAV
jgi:imidazolonepropionase